MTCALPQIGFDKGIGSGKTTSQSRDKCLKIPRSEGTVIWDLEGPHPRHIGTYFTGLLWERCASQPTTLELQRWKDKTWRRRHTEAAEEKRVLLLFIPGVLYPRLSKRLSFGQSVTFPIGDWWEFLVRLQFWCSSIYCLTAPMTFGLVL